MVNSGHIYVVKYDINKKIKIYFLIFKKLFFFIPQQQQKVDKMFLAAPWTFYYTGKL